MKQAIEYLKELFEEPFDLEEGNSIAYDFLQVIKKAQLESAISVLEEIKKSLKEDYEQDKYQKLTEWGLGYNGCTLDIIGGLEEKIQELKTYLDAKN